MDIVFFLQAKAIVIRSRLQMPYKILFQQNEAGRNQLRSSCNQCLLDRHDSNGCMNDFIYYIMLLCCAPHLLPTSRICNILEILLLDMLFFQMVLPLRCSTSVSRHRPSSLELNGCGLEPISKCP